MHRWTQYQLRGERTGFRLGENSVCFEEHFHDAGLVETVIQDIGHAQVQLSVTEFEHAVLRE